MEFQILPQQLHIIHDVRHISWTDCNDFFNFLILFLTELRSTKNCAATIGHEEVQEEKHYRKADWKEIRKVLINSRLKVI